MFLTDTFWPIIGCNLTLFALAHISKHSTHFSHNKHVASNSINCSFNHFFTELAISTTAILWLWSMSVFTMTAFPSLHCGDCFTDFDKLAIPKQPHLHCLHQHFLKCEGHDLWNTGFNSLCISIGVFPL